MYFSARLIAAVAALSGVIAVPVTPEERKITCGIAATGYLHHDCFNAGVDKTTECGPWRTGINSDSRWELIHVPEWKDESEVHLKYPGKFPGIFPEGKNAEVPVGDSWAEDRIRKALKEDGY
ncbi:hypothetical protein K402DRAFT_392214 [Aulographum hederae CBS 113979]|uniref:Uncharacterized protein n=1 Tax=Aulographum hederae CBS 113979 TaxID=1176131 RepID=A0A6G1H4D1_9PEZI|nr:hypothetical protein K402DRAFT_392214 [Aulographum hederae CBS 113979]